MTHPDAKPRLAGKTLKLFAVLCAVVTTAVFSQAQFMMVSNVEEPAPDGYYSVSARTMFGMTSSQWLSQSFTTGSLDTHLGSIAMGFSAYGQGSGFSMSLHEDGTNRPGTLLETLAGNPAPIETNSYTYTSNLLTPLLANTTYWIVASAVPESSFGATFTHSDVQISAFNWTLGDTVYVSQNLGSTWFADSSSGSLRISLTSAAIPEPSTYVLLVQGVGLIAFGAWRRRHRVRAQTPAPPGAE